MRLRKNSISHIDASHSRQPLVKGERLVRYEVNAVIGSMVENFWTGQKLKTNTCFAEKGTWRRAKPKRKKAAFEAESKGEARKQQGGKMKQMKR